jgi:hypothetical protein
MLHVLEEFMVNFVFYDKLNEWKHLREIVTIESCSKRERFRIAKTAVRNISKNETGLPCGMRLCFFVHPGLLIGFIRLTWSIAMKRTLFQVDLTLIIDFSERKMMMILQMNEIASVYHPLYCCRAIQLLAMISSFWGKGNRMATGNNGCDHLCLSLKGNHSRYY